MVRQHAQIIARADLGKKRHRLWRQADIVVAVTIIIFMIDVDESTKIQLIFYTILLLEFQQHILFAVQIFQHFLVHDLPNGDAVFPAFEKFFVLFVLAPLLVWIFPDAVVNAVQEPITIILFAERIRLRSKSRPLLHLLDQLFDRSGFQAFGLDLEPRDAIRTIHISFIKHKIPPCELLLIFYKCNSKISTLSAPRCFFRYYKEKLRHKNFLIS